MSHSPENPQKNFVKTVRLTHIPSKNISDGQVEIAVRKLMELHGMPVGRKTGGFFPGFFYACGRFIGLLNGNLSSRMQPRID